MVMREHPWLESFHHMGSLETNELKILKQAGSGSVVKNAAVLQRVEFPAPTTGSSQLPYSSRGSDALLWPAQAPHTQSTTTTKGGEGLIWNVEDLCQVL